MATRKKKAPEPAPEVVPPPAPPAPSRARGSRRTVASSAPASAPKGKTHTNVWPDVSDETRELVEAREGVRKELNEPDPTPGDRICPKTGRVEGRPGVPSRGARRPQKA